MGQRPVLGTTGHNQFPDLLFSQAVSFLCSLFQASSETHIKVLLLAFIALKVTLVLNRYFSYDCLKKKGQISSSIHPQGSNTKLKYWQLARYKHLCWSHGPDYRSLAAWKYVQRNSTILLFIQLWKCGYRVSLVNSFFASVGKEQTYITNISFKRSVNISMHIGNIQNLNYLLSLSLFYFE